MRMHNTKQKTFNNNNVNLEQGINGYKLMDENFFNSPDNTKGY